MGTHFEKCSCTCHFPFGAQCYGTCCPEADADHALLQVYEVNDERPEESVLYQYDQAKAVLAPIVVTIIIFLIAIVSWLTFANYPT